MKTALRITGAKLLKELERSAVAARLLVACLTGLFPAVFLPVSGQSVITVFSESFDNATSTQPWPHSNTGWFKSGPLNTLEYFSGQGKALKVNFPQGTVGTDHGLGNYRIPLDSSYKELYLSWEYYVSSNFDYGWADRQGGGKFFGGFAGGSMTAIPNIDTTDYDGWVSIFMFQNGNYTTYNYFKGSSFSGGWPLGDHVANIVKGQWRRITIRLKINDGDLYNGLFEVFDNDVLVYQLLNAKIVNRFHPEYLIEHIYLNSFFGGSGDGYRSPIDQYMAFDNITAFYYPEGSTGYRSGPSEKGRTIQVPQPSAKYPAPPNQFTPTTYTDASGVIESHCGFYHPVNHVETSQTAVIQVSGATSLNLNVTKFKYDAGVNYLGYKQILKIYQGTGSGKVLVRTYQNGIYTTPGTVKINGNSATLEWQAGAGNHNGFTIQYTSNGTGSGKNFVCHDCVARQGEVTPEAVIVPATPTNLSMTDITDRTVTLQWKDNSDNESWFEIERTGPDYTVPAQTFISNANTNTFLNSGLIGHTSYTYRMRAYNSVSGYSAWSNSVEVTTDYALPNAPSALTSTGHSEHSVDLAWTDNSNIELGFKLERSLSATGTYTEIAALSENNTAYTDSQLEASTQYFYRLRSYNQAGNSSYTAVLQASTASPDLVLPPSSLYSTAQTKHTIQLRWSDNSTNETGFNLFRSLSEEQDYKEIADLPSNAGAYTDSLLEPGTIYYYKVRAYNDDGYSAFTSVLEAKTTALQIPAAPTNLAIMSTDLASVSIQWDDNADNETGFDIERLGPDDTIEPFSVTLPANTNVFSDTGMITNGTYSYRVRAGNDDGVSDWSDFLEVFLSDQEVILNNPPVIQDQQFTVEEYSFSNNYIGKIAASDPDGQNLTWAIISGNTENLFTVGDQNGDLMSSRADIFNTSATQYELVVQVTDDGEFRRSSSARITVNLLKMPATIYINPDNANDGLEDGSIDHPFDSWQDVTWKGGTTYLQKRGSTARIDKININADNVVLGAYGEGALPVITSEINSFIIKAYDRINLTISNLHIIGEHAVSCIYIFGSACENITIEKCKLEGAVNAVRIIEGDKAVLRYNTFLNTQEAVYSYAKNMKIYYNVFSGNQSAIHISSVSSAAEVYNNVFYDNRQGLTNSYSALTLYNNIFYLTRGNDIAVSNAVDEIISDYNIFYPEQTGFIQIGDRQFDNLSEYQHFKGIDLNSFAADPRFVDVYDMNFSLREESPAVDAGKLLDILVDYAGVKIPYGDGPDIGVSELVAVSHSGFEENPLPEGIELSAFPNPSSGAFKVRIRSDEGTRCPLQILDLNGRLLYSCYAYADGQGVMHADIDISGAPPAVYLVQATAGLKVFTERILIR